jgi:broad specificity phosphatase PhoE
LTLLLVRHGETEANAARLLLGRAESPLTERGRAQAASLGPLLGSVARLVSSPLERARETAEALGLGLPVEVDERWIEVDYGAYDGQALSDVPAEVWRRWRTDPHFRPPSGGESLAEMGTRVRAACQELFARDGAGARGAGDVVVVSHVSPIKAAVAWALGADDTLAWRLYLATASVTEIGWSAGTPLLQRYNVTVPQTGASTASLSGRAGGRLS